MTGLENYLALLSRVDEICRRTSETFSAHITCRAGCDACCRHLSIFAVEAAALRKALRELPAEQAELVRAKARETREGSPCPLLHDGLCLLYQARPIICRTHGLPLLLLREGERSVDFCPENFQGLPSIPGSAVMDLERLNMMLATVNALYLQSFPGPERLTMAQALLSD
ncbi:YkgJ family cysteine cluster protein [Geomonas nitrogeniifigens]|uniref:YkgJ family cysteine cluster protein n=1 Tax=Geomonas diazotrophica TaxID=2843197 RepID=A0ABX8JLI1_9BACT|nr:YkgJ family cysteine cluster protein [Geomonas nitrogeniifigens]QWV98826.1 YkgJ family cysteine cluster protein [Geomonas nitrogeniifigens]